MVKDIQVIWEMVANMEIGLILKIVILNELNAGVGKKTQLYYRIWLWIQDYSWLVEKIMTSQQFGLETNRP